MFLSLVFLPWHKILERVNFFQDLACKLKTESFGSFLFLHFCKTGRKFLTRVHERCGWFIRSTYTCITNIQRVNTAAPRGSKESCPKNGHDRGRVYLPNENSFSTTPSNVRILLLIIDQNINDTFESLSFIQFFHSHGERWCQIIVGKHESMNLIQVIRSTN